MSTGTQEEISLSVEETNAIRAKLGLKPLHVTTKKSFGLPVVPEKPVEKVIDTEKQEGKRMAEALTSGGGVLDVFGSDESPLNWLSKLPKRVQTEEANQPPVDDSESSSGSDGSSSYSSSDSDSSSDSE
jgi:hypothetical protein